MRGQVLGVDRTSGEGQISGEDGLRYAFSRQDWSGEKGPAIGVRVDFETNGARALRIFRLPEAEPLPAGGRALAANDRNKYVAALLAFFFGVLGIHRFYLGRNGTAVVMLVISATIVGLLVTSVWAFVDMIRYLIMSDAEFAHRYARYYP
ncbi:TM2 domain-containing protein [Sphingomonas sp. JC676]|uniref:TM2 domain-containing protein n=1 Tax=Sphingomonas sp. JC676 TaxID=2768065 RepID=UPI0016579219|nr:TM2 domain-containing protein [Sphingomonas sp. JC676]MBC9031624.1 TM2 domain-containing protein [Sphingomonas sp. JC676]